MNNRDLTINGLLACGATEIIPSPSRKYRAFRSPWDASTIYFVGGSGALRCGPKVTGSFSLTDTRRHKALREVGDPAIHWGTPEQARAAFLEILGG